jgi:hypothetical protein
MSYKNRVIRLETSAADSHRTGNMQAQRDSILRQIDNDWYLHLKNNPLLYQSSVDKAQAGFNEEQSAALLSLWGYVCQCLKAGVRPFSGDYYAAASVWADYCLRCADRGHQALSDAVYHAITQPYADTPAGKRLYLQLSRISWLLGEYISPDISPMNRRKFIAYYVEQIDGQLKALDSENAQ